MAAAYLFDLWYQLVPGKWIVDSDLASEMILSDLLNKEGTIISHNWFYSTELKVVNLQWFYRLGLLIFPNDWHLARTFGMAITLALFAACMLFFVKCARLGRPGLWMVGTLLWPFGQHYLVYAIYGGYYLVYTFFICWYWRWSCAASTPTKALRAAMARGLHRHGHRGHERRQAAHGVPRAALHCRGDPAGACTARQRYVRLKTALQHCRRQVRLFAASLVTAVAGAAGISSATVLCRGCMTSNPTTSSSGTATRIGSPSTAS